MKDELPIGAILLTVIVALASMTAIHPNENICNEDYCMINYYEKFQSDPRFKI